MKALWKPRVSFPLHFPSLLLLKEQTQVQSRPRAVYMLTAWLYKGRQILHGPDREALAPWFLSSLLYGDECQPSRDDDALYHVKELPHEDTSKSHTICIFIDFIFRAILGSQQNGVQNKETSHMPTSTTQRGIAPSTTNTPHRVIHLSSP